MDGAIDTSLASIAFSKLSSVWCAGPGTMKISVEAHHTITHRATPCFFLKSRMSSRSCSARSRLVFPCLDVDALEPLDVVLVEHRRHRLDRLEEVLDRLDMLVLVEHPAVQARLVGVVRHRIPRPEDQVLERGERDKVPDQRCATFGALAEPDGGHLRQRAVWLGEPAPREFGARNERGCDGTESDAEHTELAVGWRQGPSRVVNHAVVLSTGGPQGVASRRTCTNRCTTVMSDSAVRMITESRDHHPILPATEKGRRDTEQEDPLGALEDADRAVDAEPLGPGSHVRHQQGGHDGHHAGDHRHLPQVDPRRVGQVRRNADERDAIANPIKGRIIEGAESGGERALPGDLTIKSVDDAAGEQEAAAPMHRPESVGHRRNHREEQPTVVRVFGVTPLRKSRRTSGVVTPK